MVTRLMADRRGVTLTLVVLASGALVLFLVVLIQGAWILPKDLAGQQAADRSAMASALWTARGLNILSLTNLVMALLLSSIILLDATFYTALLALMSAVGWILICVWAGGSCVEKASKEAKFAGEMAMNLSLGGALADAVELPWEGMKKLTTFEERVLRVVPPVTLAAGAIGTRQHDASGTLAVPGSLLKFRSPEEFFPVTQEDVDFTRLCGPVWAGEEGGYWSDWLPRVLASYGAKPLPQDVATDGVAATGELKAFGVDMPEGRGPLFDPTQYIPYWVFWAINTPMSGWYWVVPGTGIAAGTICGSDLAGDLNTEAFMEDRLESSKLLRRIPKVGKALDMMANQTDSLLGIPEDARGSENNEASVRPARLVDQWKPGVNWLSVAWATPKARRRVLQAPFLNHKLDGVAQFWMARGETANACSPTLFSPQWEAHLAPLARLDEDGEVSLLEWTQEASEDDEESASVLGLTEEVLQWLVTQ